MQTLGICQCDHPELDHVGGNICTVQPCGCRGFRFERTVHVDAGIDSAGVEYGPETMAVMAMESEPCDLGMERCVCAHRRIVHCGKAQCLIKYCDCREFHVGL